MGPLQASEMIRDREGRLIGRYRDGSDRILRDPTPGTAPVPDDWRGSTIRYTLMTLRDLHQRGRAGDMVSFQGYMSSHALDLSKQPSRLALIFETRVVQEPVTAVDLSAPARYARRDLSDRCNTVCHVSVQGHFETRGAGVITVVAHQIAVLPY